MRIRITSFAVPTIVALLALVGLSFPASALPIPAPPYTPLVEYPNVSLAATQALKLNIDKWYSTAHWNDMVLWNTTIEQNKQRASASAQRQPQVHAVTTAPSSVQSSVSSGHDPCAAPELGILPSYIVNRESRGQCGAYNAGGCSGRGCIGWAQVDAGHFWLVSPWGGRGTCYGLSYNDCVNKLSNGGTNLAPWGA